MNRSNAPAPTPRADSCTTGAGDLPAKSAGADGDAVTGGHVVYVRNPTRAHKILPLLTAFQVHQVDTARDVLRLRSPLRRRSVVVTDAFGRFGALGIFASVVLASPLVLRLRGEFFREARDRRGGGGPAAWARYVATTLTAKACLWRCSGVIYNSAYLQNAFAAHLPRKPSDIVHNPYTPREPRAAPCRPPLTEARCRLLTVTNMGLASKVDPFLTAISAWVPRQAWEELDIHWIVCGDGRNKQLLSNAIDNLGLRDRIHLVGHVEDIDSYYDWAQIVVHLTDMDAFPNVPLEAMMHERPVITNPTSCGTLEIVRQGFNGAVVGDSRSFLEAVQGYLSPALSARHGAAGKRFVEATYSVDAQREKMTVAVKRYLPTPAARETAVDPVTKP